MKPALFACHRSNTKGLDVQTCQEGGVFRPKLMDLWVQHHEIGGDMFSPYINEKHCQLVRSLSQILRALDFREFKKQSGSTSGFSASLAQLPPQRRWEALAQMVQTWIHYWSNGLRSLISISQSFRSLPWFLVATTSLVVVAPDSQMDEIIKQIEWTWTVDFWRSIQGCKEIARMVIYGC